MMHYKACTTTRVNPKIPDSKNFPLRATYISQSFGANIMCARVLFSLLCFWALSWPWQEET